MYHCVGIPYLVLDMGSCSGSDGFKWNGARVIPYQGAPSSTASATVPPGTSPTTSPCPNTDSWRRKIGLAAGLGIALPLLVVAATFGLLWGSERKKRVRAGASTKNLVPRSRNQREYGPPFVHELETTPNQPGELNGEGAKGPLLGGGK